MRNNSEGGRFGSEVNELEKGFGGFEAAVEAVKGMPVAAVDAVLSGMESIRRMLPESTNE